MAPSLQDAVTSFRNWRSGRPEGLRNIYFIGHGSGAFALSVSVTDDPSAEPTMGTPLTSPAHFDVHGTPSMRDAGEGAPPWVRDSRQLFAAIAGAMRVAGGAHRFEVRACYLVGASLELYAMALGFNYRDLHAEVAGYTDYYALVEMSRGRWRSRIETRGGRVISQAGGTDAPPAQIVYCVRDAQVTEGRCR